MTKQLSTLYLAGGCFWGTQHYLKQIAGVVATSVGYANGTTPYPTYDKVCTGTTGHAEAVRVDFDPQVLPLALLVRLYFRSIDPTSINRQGNDIGTQYRTGVYYTSPDQLPAIEAEHQQLEAELGETSVVEILPLHSYYEAEDYHQDYLDHHPTGYCHLPKALFDYARTANAQGQQP